MARSTGPHSFASDLAAAVAAATVIVVSFGVFHTLWIRNVPAVFTEGLILAMPAALAITWAIRATRRAAGNHCALSGVAIGGMLWLSLLPYELAGALHGPWPEPRSAAEAARLAWIVALGAPVGAAFGWIITRRALPAVAWAVAATVINVVLGGSIAFFGGRGVVLGLFLWLLPTYLVAGLVLERVRAMIERRAVPAAVRDGGAGA